jgi:pyrroline-5-carboxylate reductase
VRVMPNTPVLIGKGMSVLSAGAHASADHLALISTLLSTSGAVMYIDESLQDAVTAVSGSGPAYFFAFIEAMVAGGVALGLSAEVATELSIQTIIGAAAMLAESGKSATTLRENVTSPNGTTAAALTRFSQGHLAELVAGAMTAARDRSQELA